MDGIDQSLNKELLLEVLGNLAKLRKAFPYTLLLYALSPKDVFNLLDIFQGTTITFPTKEELMDCVTFSIVQKYGGYDKTPKEVLNGLTKRKYKQMLAAIEGID